MTTTAATSTDVNRDALENQFGLADRVVDEAALANSVERFRAQGITLPTFAQLADPSTYRPRVDGRRRRSAGPGRPQPVAGPLVQRPRWRPGRGARTRGAPVEPHRRREPDHRRVRRPFPDDHRPQGARRVRMPRAARGDRAVRPDPAPGDLAVDGELRPRGHRHQPHHGEPGRGDPARGHEPGAVRLARPVVREPGRRRDQDATARSRTSRRSTTPATSWRKDPDNFVLNQFSEFGNHLGHSDRHRPGVGAGVRARARHGEGRRRARSGAGRVHLGDGIGRHDRAPATG